jgi:hypothetical protein
MLLVVLVFLHEKTALAQDFSAEGTLVHREFLPGKGEVSESEEKFSVFVSGSRYSISESRLAAGKFLHKQTTFDGTNIFQLVTFPPPEPRPQKGTPIFMHGSIIPWEMPPPDLLFGTAPLWLAFASAGHLNGSGSGALRPTWVPNENGLWHRGFKTPANWRLNQSLPHLPEIVTYYDDGSTHPANGTPFLLYAGFTNVIYSANFTNLGQLSIPAQFALKRFVKIPPPGDSVPKEIFLMGLDEAVVKSATPVCVVDQFRPALKGIVLISDCRLQALYPDFGRRYVVSNGDWSLIPYSALLERHARAPARPRMTAESGIAFKRNVMFWIMFATCGVFAVLTFKATHRPAVSH